MPELAAHLERVAKELAREVFKAQHLAYREVDSTAWKCTCGETPKDIVEHWVGHVEGVLAAALAACAREEALEWDRTAQLHISRWIELEWRNERLAALERAVGESSLDPQGGQHES